MTAVPLGVGAYLRQYGQMPQIELFNRFFEQTPTNQVEGSALLARPGNTFFTSAGVGPIRVQADEPGMFNDDMFFVSGEQLFRYDGTTPIAIAGTVAGTTTPSIAFVSGAAYEHLFITDGVLMQVYDGISAASSNLTVSTPIIAADTLELDGVFYAWTAGSVDAGTPAGTVTDPWLVTFADDTTALANAVKALNTTGLAGTDYSTALTKHLTVGGTSSTATVMLVTARTRGTAGNAITSTETGAGIGWSGATLAGGEVHALKGIVTPDDITFVSLTSLLSFSYLAQSKSQRFYWIQPGAQIIDALDFAEAESKPDEIIELVAVGDALYMMGQSSTEVWAPKPITVASPTPVRRIKGLAFNQGALEGTTVAIRTQLITIARDGVVYSIVGGPKRISNTGIEERIRLFRKALGV